MQCMELQHDKRECEDEVRKKTPTMCWLTLIPYTVASKANRVYKGRGGNERRGEDALASSSVFGVVMTIHYVKQINRLKKDFNTVQHHNDRLLHQPHECDVVQSRVQKRRWSQASYSEANNSSGSPHKQARASWSGCTREQIRDVLGGPDRGWGSMQYVSIFLSFR